MVKCQSLDFHDTNGSLVVWGDFPSMWIPCKNNNGLSGGIYRAQQNSTNILLGFVGLVLGYVL